MKAIVQDKYGPPDEVLRLTEINKPVVGDDEVLMRIRAASVHADVWHVVTGRPYAPRLMTAALRRPKNPIPGTDMAGHVESVGKDVTRFSPGDEVFGESHSGLQWHNGGAYAEYVSAPQSALALKPNSVTFIAAIWLTASDKLFEQRIYRTSRYRTKSPRQKKMIDKFLTRTRLYNKRMIDSVNRLGLVSLDVENASNVAELTTMSLSGLNQP